MRCLPTDKPGAQMSITSSQKYRSQSQKDRQRTGLGRDYSREPGLAQVRKAVRRVDRDTRDALAINGDDGKEVLPVTERQVENVALRPASGLIGNHRNRRRAASVEWIRNQVLEIAVGNADGNICQRTGFRRDRRLPAAGGHERAGGGSELDGDSRLVRLAENARTRSIGIKLDVFVVGLRIIANCERNPRLDG